MKKLLYVIVLGLYCILLACITIGENLIVMSKINFILAVIIFTYILFQSLNIGRRKISLIRGYIYSFLSKSKARHLSIDKGFRVKNIKAIQFGDYCNIGCGVDIYPLGENEKKIILGNNVNIGDYNRFACSDSIIIEDNVLFAAYVHITDHSHEFKNINQPIVNQGIFSKGPVHIKEGAWLGYRADILAGVTIGRNSVVASGAVVTKDVPDYCVVAGCPAKLIKKYDFEKEEWVSVLDEKKRY